MRMPVITIIAFLAGLCLVYFAFYPVKGDDVFQVYLPFYIYAAVWFLGAMLWWFLRSGKPVVPLIVAVLFCAIAFPVWTWLRFDHERLRYNAARYNHRTILKILLVLEGSKQDQLDKALLDSIPASDVESIEYLLRKGANPNSKLLMKVPAIVLAVQAKSTSVVDLLLQAGADVNAQDDDGMTAIMWATQNNQLEILRKLLAANADPTLRNNRGETALMIAQRFHHEESESLLTLKGN
jgi:energy-coupling factor transporter transmembrane protein EcfT